MRLNLGKSIKVALAKAGMSQRQLADQMKLSVRFITKLANSKTANLSPSAAMPSLPLARSTP